MPDGGGTAGTLSSVGGAGEHHYSHLHLHSADRSKSPDISQPATLGCPDPLAISVADVLPHAVHTEDVPTQDNYFKTERYLFHLIHRNKK